MISPSNGRIVWFNPRHPGSVPGEQPQAAIVTHVWSDRMVNLCVFDPSGIPHSRTSVMLLQDDDEMPNSPFACWMPYQKGQAAKHDAAAKA